MTEQLMTTETETTPPNPVPTAFSKKLNRLLRSTEPVLSPLVQTLDQCTQGIALNYANVLPNTQATPAGQAFLATNLAYTAAGIALYWSTIDNGGAGYSTLYSSSADASLSALLFSTTGGTIVPPPLLAILLETVSVASFVYHYTQLDLSSNDPSVRLALLIDYTLAFTSIFVALSYCIVAATPSSDQIVWLGSTAVLPPVAGLVSGGLGLVFFALGCTVCSRGTSYILVHGIWHFLSAYCAYVIGDWHATCSSVGALASNTAIASAIACS